MELLYVLLVLLVVTRACSEFALRIGQPALVGELIGGVIIGIIVAHIPGIEFLGALDSEATFQSILDLAVFFLMLLAGVEMRPAELARASYRAVPVAISGMLVPLALGFALGWYWLPESDWKDAQSLFIAVALAITAVPVAVKVLVDLGRLHSKVGQAVVAAAVIDDILSLVLLAVLTAMLSADEPVTAGLALQIFLNVGIFFAIALVFGRYVLPLAGRYLHRLVIERADFSLMVISGLLFSVLAEALEMHFLIGAFTAGVIFTRNVVGEEAHAKLKSQTEAITLGFLAPVFFASIGIHLDISAILEAPLFLLVLLAAATAGKLLGAGIAARLSGFSARQATAIGAAMNARGAVEIIIADIALRAGLFDHPDPTPDVIDYLFSAVVVMAVVTTLASPLMLRRLLAGSKDNG